MTKNNLIYKLMKNSSKEMQQLLSEQFGFISEAQDFPIGNVTSKDLEKLQSKSPVAPTGEQMTKSDKPEKTNEKTPSKSEPTLGENIGEGEAGLTYNQWMVYFKEAVRSVGEARKKAAATGLQKKIQYANEYSQKVQALRQEFNQLMQDIKSNYVGFNPATTIIPESMLTGGVGAGIGADKEDLGRPQKGKKGKGGAAGDEGADFYSASNENRRFDIAPFGPFMDLSLIRKGGLISNTQLYSRVVNVFGTDVNIDNFGDMDSALAEMKSLKGKDKYNNAPEFIQNLLNLMVDIQTQWQKKRRKNLPQEYKAEQGEQASEWKRTLESLIKDFQQDIREKKESLIAPSAPGKYAK